MKQHLQRLNRGTDFNFIPSKASARTSLRTSFTCAWSSAQDTHTILLGIRVVSPIGSITQETTVQTASVVNEKNQEHANFWVHCIKEASNIWTGLMLSALAARSRNLVQRSMTAPWQISLRMMLSNFLWAMSCLAPTVVLPTLSPGAWKMLKLYSKYSYFSVELEMSSEVVIRSAIKLPISLSWLSIPSLFRL